MTKVTYEITPHKPGSIGAGNFAMNMSTKVKRGDVIPVNIKRVDVDYIEIGHRQRAENPDTIRALHDDIEAHGLLHPIGVQDLGAGRYRLIYGYHRLMVFKQGWAKANALAMQRGEKDEEANEIGARWKVIPVIVYNDAMPAFFAELKELAENLFRANLTGEETAAHRVKYAHLLKRAGVVAPAKEVKQQNQGKNSIGTKGQGTEFPDKPKMTATQKAAKDLGVTERAIKKDHAKIAKLAKAQARDEGKSEKEIAEIKLTPETPADKAEKVIAFADRKISTRVEAETKGKSARTASPIETQGDNVITVRIDIRDPDALLKWFKLRLTKEAKPLTIAFLKELHLGLGEMIKEAE